MMRRNYYCLIAGLPDITHDDKKLHFSLVKLREYLKEELHPKDFRLVELFYYPFDNLNLLNILFSKGKDWDERGILTSEQIEQIIHPKSFQEADRTLYPDHIFEFARLLHTKEDMEEKLGYFESLQYLTSEYYLNMLQSPHAFIRQVTDYKVNTGNILLALNGRKHQLPFESGLIGNNLVTGALQKNRTRDFGLSIDYPEIEQLIQLYEGDNILERELRLDYRFWNFLDEITFFHYFTLERVLAFTLKIFMVERWFLLDYEKGQVMFNQLLKEIESSFEFPEEFTNTYGKKK
jgi:hypothetical protein